MLLAFSSLASADPPSRVARIGYMSGAVSFSPAGDDEWVQATLNRPLTTGDRVWADARSRAEIQVGGAAVRMSADTDLSVLNLDDRIAQMQLTQGVLNVRVRRVEPDQTYEVDTPNLALTVRQAGAYRIEVAPDGSATTIFVHSGQVEVYGEGAAYVIDSRQPYRFTGMGLREYQYVDSPQPDDFDRWASERDRSYDNSASARYVSPEVVGYEDLDSYGAWRADPNYGNVWFPNRVSADWAPYHDGHWAWIDPWGWTWVDDAPWGFAVSHYGRWAHVESRWCWVPGPVQVRPYYAPALVAFVGGDNFQLTISTGAVGGVAWLPLGPREVYRPAYAVSRNYFERVNVSNTVVTTTVINNYYNNTNVTNVVYANRQVPGAVVAVPTTAFVQSQPVAKQAVRVPQERLVSRPVAIAPSVAPMQNSVRGSAAQGGKPPAAALARPVVAREAPPAAHPKFEAPKQEAAASRGQIPAEEARNEPKSAAPAQNPNVRVIAQKPEGRPTNAPPPVANARPGETKADAEPRARQEDGKGPPRAVASTPPVQAARPSPVPRPPEPRDASEARSAQGPRDRVEQRAQPEPRPPTGAPTPPPQVARTAPSRQPAEPRGVPEQRDRAEAPAPRPVAPPQARANPPAQEAPRPRAEAPRPPAEVPRPPAAHEAPPPSARTPEPSRPAAEARPQPPRPAPSATPPDQERKAAPRRPNDRKKNENDEKK
jgi:hypothetical protein